jgi:hypothetical protein
MGIQMDRQGDTRTYKVRLKLTEHKWTKHKPWIGNSCEIGEKACSDVK